MQPQSGDYPTLDLGDLHVTWNEADEKLVFTRVEDAVIGEINGKDIGRFTEFLTAYVKTPSLTR